MHSWLRYSRRAAVTSGRRVLVLSLALGGALALTGARASAVSNGQFLAEQVSQETADVLAGQADGFSHIGIKFTPCAENASLDCGTLVVPVDYRKPYGERAGIAVIRARTTKPAQRIGVVVGNPGGPGISGVDFVLGGINSPAFARLRERFDIVSFDPRGVSRSRAVRCVADFPDPPPDLDTADDATLAAYFDEAGRIFAKACVEQNGPWVTHLGTNNVARDIDMLRRALGEKQITYASGSYGSELGAVYASLFPDRLRAMLLDGTATPIHRDYLVEFLSEFSSAFEHSFRRLDQLCRRDPACRLADTGVVAAFDDIAARLKDAPVTSPEGTVLTAALFTNIIATLLDRESTLPLIVTALANAQAGDLGLLFQLAPFGAGGFSSAFLAISCNDYGTRRPAADYLTFDEANGALNPRFFGRFFIASTVSLCSAWAPADPPVIRDVRKRVRTPILVIGNDFDSRTPLSSARRLADMLGMERSLVRYTGGGHTAFAKTTACIQETIEAYLFDLRVPEEGFACPGRVIAFEPSTQRQTNGALPVTGAFPDFWGTPPVPRGLPTRMR
jgi:pimeloyl-ACP methyl ester carboxylesterase